MMNEPLGSTNAEPNRSNPLRQVHEGMHVYDQDDKEIGTVDRVFLGGSSPEAEDRGVGPATANDPDRSIGGDIVQDFAAVFQSDNLPEPVRSRLLRMGFFRLDAKGLFSSARYILPEQIARVEGDKVYLKTTKDKLIKREL